MKKSDINRVLKENGYEFVKYTVGTGMRSKMACYTDWDNKRVKGIKGGSVGPTTVTNAYQECNQEIINKVTNDLKKIGMIEKNDLLQSPDGKIKVSLIVSNFPQYARSCGYDESYQNCYIQAVFV